ncbi:hypothetical protein [Prosthecobacter sp.]|uniref:hypothetical protein n=1 Tax=Prosthecobacter sp. TaxID=1965333 RepID=UPI001DCF5566|nr:hypothetical protein [Prosthecobacter sp.]MCB1276590.1 hypothetical protein [Prosthecobacter sp.]
MKRRFLLTASLLSCSLVSAADPIHIGGRRELFVDHFLIEKLSGTQLQLHAPRDEGIAFKFDAPWEGGFSGYASIVRIGDKLRAYYRGKPVANKDGSDDEVTCCAESEDGIHWTRPDVGAYEVQGTSKNNVVLMKAQQVTHNFSPFLDSKPGVASDERFKAFGGTMQGGGLMAYKSADGLHWEKMAEAPVITKEMVPYKYMFDSQNVPFWSAAEKKYLCYYRVFEDGIRRIVRSESDDFLKWSAPVLLKYRNPDMEAPIEHLYTNQTSPYFRAPHLYVSIAARFMPGRRVLTDEQAAAIKVNPGYFKDTSDAIFMTTRPVEGVTHAGFYDRTFLEGFIRGGIGAQNWVSRTNYPALNVVQTGPAEMSVYVNQDYAQPTAHLRRYSMRLDGFASLHSGYAGGHMITKPLVFTGRELSLNFSTSAAGGVKVGVEDVDGKSLPGFSLEDCQMQIGNELDRKVTWKSGTDVSAVSGKPVRLRFSMKDADIYSFQFTE